jgi:hypothetical protein
MRGWGVVFDGLSNATRDGAACWGGGRGCVEGVEAAVAGGVGMMVVYAHSGAGAVVLAVVVNQVSAGTASLAPSNGAYVAATVSVGLAAGKNFITLVGGGEGVRVESIAVPVSEAASGPRSGDPSSSAA